MSIYRFDGQEVYDAYDLSGDEIDEAFSKNGDTVYLKHFSFKVMTYNVGQWYEGAHDNVPADKDLLYYALQYGMISNNAADILLLEEYTKQFSKAGRTAASMLSQDYPYYYEVKGDNPQKSIGDGRAVYSKYPISNYVQGDFNDGSGLYADRCIITIRGVPFNVFITHLNWSSGDDGGKREQEIATILNTAANMTNVIVGGDFNNGFSTTDTEESRNTKYQKYVQPFIDAGYNTANYGDDGFLITCISGTDTSSWTGMLDNIFTSGNISLSNVYVDTTKQYDSIVDTIDHMPLVATLTV